MFNVLPMQRRKNQDLEAAVVEAFAKWPAASADDIAGHIGCMPQQVRQTDFYKRVLIARIGRDPSVMDDSQSSSHVDRSHGSPRA